METTSDRTGSTGGRMRMTIALLAFLTLGGAGTTTYLAMENSNMTSDVNSGKLDNERLLGEKLQLEKRIAELHGRLDNSSEALSGAERTVDALRARVTEVITHGRSLESVARRSKDLAKEVAELRGLKQQLEVQVATAESNARDLRDQLNKMTVERDALAASLAERKEGARMVNNAEVDALRGRKGRLTVIARRTKEIRMAFDLPQNLAHVTTFKIIAPDGHEFSGADPSISRTIDEPSAEPMASIDMMPTWERGERASRVHLKFTPTEKLKPGAYRIDVMSGGDYLNTVLLNLR